MRLKRFRSKHDLLGEDLGRGPGISVVPQRDRALLLNLSGSPALLLRMLVEDCGQPLNDLQRVLDGVGELVVDEVSG